MENYRVDHLGLSTPRYQTAIDNTPQSRNADIFDKKYVWGITLEFDQNILQYLQVYCQLELPQKL